MSRLLLGAVSILAISTISCGLPFRTAGNLPSNVAAPSASIAEVSPSGPSLVAASRYFQQRGTGLTDAEIERAAVTLIREAQRFGFDPNLVLAVIQIESAGNSFAVSRVGAMGLMQIMPPTGEELAKTHGVAWKGPQSLFDPVINLRLGIAYLKQLEDRYGRLDTALAAYNWGPGRIDRRLRLGSPVPARYSRSVLDAYSISRVSSHDTGDERTGSVSKIQF